MTGRRAARGPGRRRGRLAGLTPRELEVLALAAAGRRSHVIAAQLGIGEPTVKTHLHHAYRKLGVTNRVEATRLYLSERRARAG